MEKAFVVLRDEIPAAKRKSRKSRKKEKQETKWIHKHNDRVPEILHDKSRVTRGRSHPILYLLLRVVERAEVLPEFLETSND